MSEAPRSAGRFLHDRSAPDPERPANLLLAALPLDEYRRLLPDLRLVPLAFKQGLYTQGEPVPKVWFPNGGVCSIVRRLEDGSSAEVATVGREGLLGGSAIFGADEAFGDAMVQVSDGDAYTIPLEAFDEALARGGVFAERVTRFTQALTVLIMQSAVCNSLHRVEARLARWLLMSHDRVERDVFTITHEFLAMMLGVRRPTVTTTVAALQQRGAITYRRREMVIADRAGLEALSCECYGVVCATYARLLS